VFANVIEVVLRLELAELGALGVGYAYRAVVKLDLVIRVHHTHIIEVSPAISFGEYQVEVSFVSKNYIAE